MKRHISACIIVFILIFTGISEASKVYLDVNAPNIKPLPIAVQQMTNGAELTDLIIRDLTLTGLFECIQPEAQVEKNEQPFNARSWLPLNVALVVKGRMTTQGDTINVAVSAYDVLEDKEVLKKEYSSTKGLLRPLGHSISNDIYKILTGQQGVFRSRLAFVVDKGSQKSLYISDYDGQRGFPLSVIAGVILSPKWSPTGKRLLYSAERDRSWDIYLLDLEDMKEKKLVSLKGLNMAGNFFPDGQGFVFSSSSSGKTDIHRADITSMKGYSIISSPWIDVSPNISRDGRQIVFVSNRSGSPQIYISDSQGGGVRRLTFEGTYNTSPSWSPKGDMIVYTSMSGGKQQIYSIKPDGSSPHRLTDKGNNEDPSFSPDGRFIVFSSDREGSPALYIMRANGEAQTRITPRGLKAYAPSWSP